LIGLSALVLYGLSLLLFFITDWFQVVKDSKRKMEVYDDFDVWDYSGFSFR
jgi:hypothetical protein